MIKWNDNIIIHDSIEDIEVVKSQIECGDKPLGIYCIIDSLTNNNLFEIVSIVELSNSFYKDYYEKEGSSYNKDILVFGMAKGRKNIKEVLIKLVENIIDKDGNIDKKSLYMLGGD